MFFVCIWEHVVSSYRPIDILLFDRIKVFSRSWILELHIFISFVESMNQSIQIFVLLQRCFEEEVSADWHKQLVWKVHLLHFHDMVVHQLSPFFQIESLQRSVVLYRIRIKAAVVWLPTELIWGVIPVQKHSMGEDLGTVSSVGWERFPNPLHCPFSKSVFLILVIHSGKNDRFKTHLCKQVLVCGRVSKGINMPADAGDWFELLK